MNFQSVFWLISLSAGNRNVWQGVWQLITRTLHEHALQMHNVNFKIMSDCCACSYERWVRNLETLPEYIPYHKKIGRAYGRYQHMCPSEFVYDRFGNNQRYSLAILASIVPSRSLNLQGNCGHMFFYEDLNQWQVVCLLPPLEIAETTSKSASRRLTNSKGLFSILLWSFL